MAHIKRITNIGSLYVISHAIFILILGMAICFLGEWMTSIRGSNPGYALAVVATAVGFLVPGAILAVDKYKCQLNIRPQKAYLVMCAVLFVCGSITWAAFSLDGQNTHVLTLLAAGMGIFWSLWLIRLAFYVQSCPGKSGALCCLSGVITFIGILLAVQSNLSMLTAVTAVACYMIWIGIQILLVVPLLYREWNIAAAMHKEC